MSGPRVTFRPLVRSDFPLLAIWLAEPLVARWWNHDSSPEAVERDFGSSLEHRDATEMFVAITSAQRFGLFQRYPIAAYQEYLEELSAVCTVPFNALSIDYLIGEPKLRGQGLGSTAIATFVRQAWTAFPASDDVVVPVAAGNHRSWRALERAGFSRIAEGDLTPDNPRDPREHYIYSIRRPS